MLYINAITPNGSHKNMSNNRVVQLLPEYALNVLCRNCGSVTSCTNLPITR